MQYLPRYRLRSLLILVGFISVPLSWYVYHANERKAEVDAIAQLRGDFRGIRVLRDDDWILCATNLYGVIRVRSSAPDWVQKIMNLVGSDVFLRVEEVHLWGEQFDRHCLGPISRFRSLRALSLDHTRVTRSEVDNLRDSMADVRITYTEAPKEPEIGIESLPAEIQAEIQDLFAAPGGFF